MVAHLDVALRPTAIPATGAFVVVDLLRATTTIAVLFSRGLRSLTVTAAIDDARRQAAVTPGTLLLGEVGGLPPTGFDCGNSPLETAALDVAGRDAVMVTTNGSGAVCTAAAVGPTYAGALANLDAVCRRVENEENLTIVCSGNEAGRSVALEDVCVAGAMVDRLADASPDIRLTDAARLAALAWQRGGALLAGRSSHSKFLRTLGFSDDIDFALKLNTVVAVPRVVAHDDGWARLEG